MYVAGRVESLKSQLHFLRFFKKKPDAHKPIKEKEMDELLPCRAAFYIPALYRDRHRHQCHCH